MMLTGIFVKCQIPGICTGWCKFANITKTKSGETQDNNLLTTFNAGFLGRFNLSTLVDLESGLITGRSWCQSRTLISQAPRMIIM